MFVTCLLRAADPIGCIHEFSKGAGELKFSALVGFGVSSTSSKKIKACLA